MLPDEIAQNVEERKKKTYIIVVILKMLFGLQHSYVRCNPNSLPLSFSSLSVSGGEQRSLSPAK